MRRTSTFQASAAALGLLAGFAMTPDAPSPLRGTAEPYAVAVAWRAAAPPELPVAGVQVDDWGGRLAPAPAKTGEAPRTRLEPIRVRVPARRAPAAKPAPRVERAERTLTRRQMDFVSSGVPGRGCPRQDRDPRES